jgi:hypothetical protein
MAQPSGGDVMPSYVQNAAGEPLLDSTIQYSSSIIHAANGDKQFT